MPKDTDVGIWTHTSLESYVKEVRYWSSWLHSTPMGLLRAIGPIGPQCQYSQVLILYSWMGKPAMESMDWAVSSWMVLMHEPNPIALVTDSWAVYKGLTLWMRQRKKDTWEIQHCPLWEAEMWNEIWERTRDLEVTMYHVPAHSIMCPLGNQEADQLAQVWHREESNDSQRVAHWLHRKNEHNWVHTLWEITKQMGMNLTHVCIPCLPDCKR